MPLGAEFRDIRRIRSRNHNESLSSCCTRGTRWRPPVSEKASRATSFKLRRRGNSFGARQYWLPLYYAEVIGIRMWRTFSDGTRSAWNLLSLNFVVSRSLVNKIYICRECSIYYLSIYMVLTFNIPSLLFFIFRQLYEQFLQSILQKYLWRCKKSTATFLKLCMLMCNIFSLR